MGDIFDAFSDEEHTDRARTRSEKVRTRRVRATAIIVAVVAILAGVTVAILPNVRDWISSNPVGDIFDNSVEDYEQGMEGEPVQVTIPEGSTGADMATVLVQADVVKSREAFINAFNADQSAGSIQPGTYELPTRIPGQEAVALLKDHDGQRIDITITIPEGFTKTQVHERVANLMDIPIEDVTAASENAEAIGLPDEADGSVEGWYMPGQYMFGPDTPVHDVLGEMIDARVAELDRLEIPAEDRQELLIKASILEREVNQADHYPKVARVIENRLADTTSVNGRLQMDSTVLYGVGKSGGIPTRAELDDDNPYNSYMYAGLPPTPIGAPGHAAVEGILDPAEGDWLYFVTVDLYTGETLFASTLEEHNANKLKLDEWLEKNPDYGSGATAPAQEEPGDDK